MNELTRLARATRPLCDNHPGEFGILALDNSLDAFAARYRLAEMAQFKVTQILKVSWFWIDLAVPVGALATALYTLYWLITDIKQPHSGDEKQ